MNIRKQFQDLKIFQSVNFYFNQIARNGHYDGELELLGFQSRACIKRCCSVNRFKSTSLIALATDFLILHVSFELTG